MNTVKDIEKAVVSLSKPELTRFRTWFTEFDFENWDLQIESDVGCGRLEKLVRARYSPKELYLVKRKSAPQLLTIQKNKELPLCQGWFKLQGTWNRIKLRCRANRFGSGKVMRIMKHCWRLLSGRSLCLHVIQAPNATTVKAMKELADGKGKRFISAEELFRDIGV